MTIQGLIAAGATVLLATSVSAQNPKPATPQAPADAGGMATVEGCLRTEKQVPGRSPNVAERAGVMEDYILTDAKVVKGTAPAMRTPSASNQAATGTAGTMFEVTGIDDEKLKSHVGKRVQVDGRFDSSDARTAGASAQDRIEDLVEIDGTTIREVAGTCAAR